MILLTKGPVLKQRIDTLTGSESQEGIRVEPMSDHGT